MPQSNYWVGFVIAAFFVGLGIGYMAFHENTPSNTTSNSIASFSMAFDSTKYVLNHIGKISISDKNGNTNSAQNDTIHAKVTSTSDPVGFQAVLNETGPNTGMFVGNLIFTGNTVPSTNSIHVSAGDMVTVSYGAVSTTAEIEPDTGAGMYATSALPLVIDPEIIYAQSSSAIRAYDLTSWNANTLTVTAHISSTTDATGFDVILTRDSTNTGTYRSNLITFSTSGSIPTSLILGIPSTATVNAVKATYGSNTAFATVQIVPVAQTVTSPSITTGLTCAAGDDRDNDGICDSWEQSTGLVIPYNGATYSVPCTHTNYDPTNDPVNANRCPDSGRPDVYVQVSWMQGHQPSTTQVLANVVSAFENAPVTNSLSGKTGITLHILVDQIGTQHIDSIPIDGSATNTIGFRQLKDRLFMTPADRQLSGCATAIADCETAKRQVFHYAMFIHDLSDTPGSSGWGEIGGNDFIISLGSFKGQVGTTSQQVGTFMHELGHNLNLNHGGPGSASFNCKPSDLSVMNYLYQFNSASGGFLSSRPLDYSEVRVTYDESQLSEQTGVGAINDVLAGSPPNPQKIAIAGVLTDASGAITRQFPPINITTGGPADFNQNHVTDTTSYGQNTHYFGIPDCTDISIQSLGGFNEWAALNFNFRPSSLFANGVYTQASTTPGHDNFEHEITSNDVQQIFSYNGVPLSKQDPAASIHFFADADFATTSMNTPVTIHVLDNDYNDIGNPVHVTSVTQGAKGSAVINSDNTVTYTPQHNVTGNDTFTYTITDVPGGNSADATVHVSIGTSVVIGLDHPSYSVGDTVNITVSNATANVNHFALDSIMVHVRSDSDPAGFNITLTETGADSGIFSGSIMLRPTSSPADAHLGVQPNNDIYVEYGSQTATATVS